MAFGPQGLRRYARASLLCVARVSAGAPADIGGAPAGGAAAGGGMGAVAPAIGAAGAAADANPGRGKAWCDQELGVMFDGVSEVIRAAMRQSWTME